MPTSQQKAVLAQFCSITGVTDKVAQRFLKNTGWKLNEAVDAHFGVDGIRYNSRHALSASPNRFRDSTIFRLDILFYASNPGQPSAPAREKSLKDQFESLRNPQEDGPDVIGAAGAESYLQSIGVNFEDASFFLALYILKAETVGEITKDGFVKGWVESGTEASIPTQKAYFQAMTSSMTSSPETFKKVYQNTFNVSKESSQKAIPLENALTFWDMLFKTPGRPWIGKQTGIDWLALWTTFLKEKWTRSINKDMWNQTLKFAIESSEDESLSFWSEDGAWHSVVDLFVAWYREKFPSGSSAGNAMDLDA
ncbi:Cullin binding-domain-containing protein [Xylariales sp. AK1849]|nr:Cullin binding-domain-containing protein [Xylariales sp. AK1849]